jgi:hypothetical protein
LSPRPHPLTRSHAPRDARWRHAGVAVTVTVCLFAWLALLPAYAAVAQDRSGSPTPEKLWKAYPLVPTAAPSATSSPAALAQADGKPLAAGRPSSDGGAPVLVFVLLALLMAGGAVTFLGVRRRRDGEPQAADVPRAPTSAPAGRPAPALRHGGPGRFSPATARTSDSRATTVVASAHTRGGGGPHAGGDAPKSKPAAVSPAGDPSPVAAAAPAGAPPDRRLAWTAEIEWRHRDGESRFCVIARGAGTVTIAESPPLEWPPGGPAAVQAMTAAAEKLAATLVTAGWKALPPGRSWYAKRFAWAPVRAEATPVRSAAAAEAPSDQGAPQPARRRGRRLALLCVLIALGALAVLQLSRGDDNPRDARPAPAAGATATPAREPSHGTDLSVPLLVLLGLVPVVLLIRKTRRARR